jgi:hypothetical protein
MQAPAEIRPALIMAPLDEDDNWFDPDAKSEDTRSTFSVEPGPGIGHDYALASPDYDESLSSEYIPISGHERSPFDRRRDLYAAVGDTATGTDTPAPTRVEGRLSSAALTVLATMEEDYVDDEADESDRLLAGSRT